MIINYKELSLKVDPQLWEQLHLSGKDTYTSLLTYVKNDGEVYYKGNSHSWAFCSYDGLYAIFRDDKTFIWGSTLTEYISIIGGDKCQ